MKLNILGAEYDLELQDDVTSGGQQCYGLAFYSTHQIIVSTDNLSEQRQTSALLHEVIHSVLCEAGYTEHVEEHVVVLGSGLLSFLRQNPEIVPVLLGEKTLDSVVKKKRNCRKKRKRKSKKTK